MSQANKAQINTDNFTDCGSSAPTWLALLVAAWAAAWAMTAVLEWPLVLIFGLPLLAWSLSFGAQAGDATWRRRMALVRGLALIIWTLLGAALGWRLTMQSGASDFSNNGIANSNLGVAVVGALHFLLVLSLLATGDGSGDSTRSGLVGESMSRGRSFWSRPIAPWHRWSTTSPLALLLALFIVLLAVNDNSVTLLSFAVFAISALFAVAYDRGRTHTEGDKHFKLLWPSRTTWLNAARHLTATALWIVLFVVGGAALYGPLTLGLLRQSGRDNGGGTSVGTALLSIVGASRRGEYDMTARLDWRGDGKTMELRGGAHPLSDRVMMRVRVDAGQTSGLWRGRVLDHYSDAQWQTTADSVRLQPDRANFSDRQWQRVAPQQRTPTTTNGKFDLVRETFEPADDMYVPQLFASGAIVRVRGPWAIQVQPENGVVDAGLFPNHNRRYEVESRVPRLNEARLLIAPGLSKEQIDRWQRDTLSSSTLRGPSRQQTQRELALLDGEFIGWAHRTNRRLDTPWRVATALRQWIAARCAYSLQAPTVPMTSDPNVFFLRDSRRGACDLFASSLALLLRRHGVPSRIATGYLQPEHAEANNPRLWVAREQQAHAWVELWIPGFGWLPFDATVGTHTAGDNDAANGLHWPLLSATSLLLSGGALLLLIGGAWQWLDSRPRRANMTPEAAARAAIEAAYAQATRSLSRQVPRTVGRTAHEYRSQVQASSLPATLKSDFALLSAWLERARYDQTPPAVDGAQLRAIVSRIRTLVR